MGKQNKYNHTKKKLLYFLLVISFLCCSGKKELTYHVELQQVKNFNSELEKDERAIFRFISAFTVDREENVYVIDNNKRLLKIGKTGKVQWELKTKGQGPGEFLRITDVCCSKDRVFVCDQYRRKILTFSKDGRFIDEFLIKIGVPIDIEIDKAGLIYISFFYLVKGDLLHKYDQQGMYHGSLIKKKYNKKDKFFDCGVNRFSFCIDGNNQIFLAYHYDYSIYKYDTTGRLLNKWSRKLPYKPEKPRLIKPDPNSMEIKGDLLIRDITMAPGNKVLVLWGSRGTDKGMQVDLFSLEGDLLSEFHTGIKPYYDCQRIFMSSPEYFFVVNKLKEPNIYKFNIAITGKN